MIHSRHNNRSEKTTVGEMQQREDELLLNKMLLKRKATQSRHPKWYKAKELNERMNLSSSPQMPKCVLSKKVLATSRIKTGTSYVKDE